MPLDPAYVGRTYPPAQPYLAGREKIREFADAIGDPNPAYRDPEVARKLGHPDVIAPPTFPMVITAASTQQLLFDPELGLDYGRMVHGEQRFVHARPIRAGDRLAPSLTVESIRSIAGNEILGTRTDLHDQDGELVATGYATLIVRGPEA
ncbi:MAG: MaoC family dehydratase N-terminal domain-containing protein [Sporichthyaceae bacterium]|nr:MaoC family dehydratase N-terminal domain-containing protein [Sporichthyaceae bacterium]